jgi:hypothetical protein
MKRPVNLRVCHRSCALLPLALAVAGLLLIGCASTLQSRVKERPEVYAQLSPETRNVVDQGNLVVGMTEDEVYLSWGKPAQVLQQQNETGTFTIWLYTGSDLRSDWYWRQQRLPGRPMGGWYCDPFLVPIYEIQDYIKAELVFSQNKLLQWRTLPRPPY